MTPASFIENDLSALFSVADFSVPVTTPNGETTGVFEDKDVEVDDGQGGIVIQRVKMLTCRSSAGIAIGDTLTIEGAQYTARVPEDDGGGVVVWHLERL